MPGVISEESVFHSLQVKDTPNIFIPAFYDAVKQVEDITNELAARVMIVKLFPNGVIYEHIDEGRYAEATNRYHIPIESNDLSWLQIEDERLNMKPGELWYFDKHSAHSGANEGDTDRVHLIVDTFKGDNKWA